MRSKMMVISLTMLCISVANAQERYGIGAFIGVTNRAVISYNTPSQWQFGFQLGTLYTEFDNLGTAHTAIFVKRFLSQEKVTPYVGISTGLQSFQSPVFICGIPIGLQTMPTNNLAVSAELAPTFFAYHKTELVLGASVGVTFYLD